MVTAAALLPASYRYAKNWNGKPGSPSGSRPEQLADRLLDRAPNGADTMDMLVLLAAVASATCGLAARGRRGQARRAWAALAVSTAMWAATELLEAGTLLDTAVGGWVLLGSAGLLLHWNAPIRRVTRVRSAIEGVVITTGALLVLGPARELAVVAAALFLLTRSPESRSPWAGSVAMIKPIRHTYLLRRIVEALVTQPPALAGSERNSRCSTSCS